MKKIGETIDGNILVEMTPAEFEGLVKPALIDGPERRRKLAREISRKVHEMPISNRAKMSFLRGIRYDDIEFENFEEWRDDVLKYPDQIRDIRQVGEKSANEIIEGLKLSLLHL